MPSVGRMKRSRQARGIFWGSAMVLVGGWFLLSRMGIDLPGLDQLWPIFPMLSGFGSLAAFFSRGRRDPGLVFPGVIGVLIGLFFIAFTFNFWSWSDMAVLWPVFPLICGLAFLSTWLAGACREKGLLVPGGLSTAVGGIGLFLTLGEMTAQHVRLVGSISILTVGGVMVYQALRPRRT